MYSVRDKSQIDTVMMSWYLKPILTSLKEIRVMQILG